MRIGRGVTWVATIAVVAHLVVVVLHGNAHTELRVDRESWQTVFVRIGRQFLELREDGSRRPYMKRGRLSSKWELDREEGGL